MSRFLLTGPEKIGKSVAANRIADALGCAHIKHEWDGFGLLSDNVLAITNHPYVECQYQMKDLVTFKVKTAEGLQALVEALEFKPIHSKQFHAAKKLADIAAWLDGHKNYIPTAQRQEASDHIETLHDYAMNTAGYRIAEIYSPEEGAHW